MDDKPNQVPAPAAEIIKTPSESSVGEFQQVLTAVGTMLEPFVRIQTEGEVEKARIESATTIRTMDVQADFGKHLSNERQTRFKWIATISTVFGVLIFALAVILVIRGNEKLGVLLITHLVVALLGFVAGQGVGKKVSPGSGGADDSS